MRRDIEICERLGLPLSRFYGWSAEDQGWFQALAEYRRLLCPCGCGELASVSQAIENDDRYVVSLVRCHARTAISKESTRRQDSDQPDALLFRAELKGV